VTDNSVQGPNLGIPGIDSVVEIGRSPTHTTFRVRDVATGRNLVVKLLNAGRDWPGLPERFELEQTAMAGLAHPNIVPVFGHGWTETGMPYIVTGEAPGGSIGDRLRGPTPMTGPDILALGVRMAGALESAHRVGVVHGDLRPDDMRLTPTGEPVLADFGVVTLVRPNAASVTDPADLAHVAPELLDGTPASAASDVYSLGSALFALFTGLPAFVRPGEQNVVPAIKRISSDPVPDLAAKNVPAPVAAAITKAMSKSPAERPHDAEDFGRALQQAQVSLGLPMTEMVLFGAAPTAQPKATAAPTSGAAMAPPPTAAAGPPPAGGPPPQAAVAGSKPNRTPLIIGIVAGVVVIALIAFFLTRGGDDKKGAAGTTTTTTTTTQKTTTTTTATTAPAEATETINNDGGQIEVTVPTTWSERDGANLSNGDPSLRAGTDLNEFAQDNTFLAPGIEAVIFQTTEVSPADLDAALNQISQLDRAGNTLETLCTRGTREDFTPTGAGLAAGRTERLTGCNGGGDVIILAATDANQSFTLLAEIHVGQPPDEDGATGAFDSLNVVKFP
jgi:hypothetical protein